MKHVGFFVALFCVPVVTVFSAGVTTHVAQQVAIAFLTEQMPSRGNTISSALSIQESFIISDESDEDQNNPLYYLFNLSPDGWIAVASDDRVHPILAYSWEGRYDPTLKAPAFSAWMKQYSDQIRHAIQEDSPSLPLTTSLWERYTKNPEPRTAHRGIEPLITSSWNQSPWYNALCPADPSGPGGHCVAGCVPVCMAQVMYYFRWPETGTGSYVYTDPHYGLLSADFGATTYAWDEMTDAINQSNPAIATLIFHLGVSCDLQYGPDGSGMYNHKAAYALRSFFKYSPETQYLFRDSTNLNWDSVLIAHLDQKIPLYYAGWDNPNISGHAFVCDGYQDSCYFHFNFGWGGSNDGYFYTSDLTPGGYNFNLAQEIVINCYPDTANYTWPVQCSGHSALTTKVGSFEDGSGPIDPYLPTAQCSWLIDPQLPTDSVSGIALNICRFDTHPGDLVTVYNGDATSDSVLGQFSGDQIPPVIISDNNQMLVTFMASGNASENGFYATYKANQPVWCTGTTSIKADTAEFSDGSFAFNYYNNSLCKWKVESESGDTLTLHFKSFDTEPGKDFLTIYDLGTGDTLASLSGYYPPESLPDSVTSPSGKMFLIFNTNSSITAEGWEIYYPKKSNTGIGEQQAITGIHLYPNPASTETSVEFTSRVSDDILLQLFAADGQSVAREAFHATPGKTLYHLNLSGIRPGLYLLYITGNHGAAQAKLMVQ